MLRSSYDRQLRRKLEDETGKGYLFRVTKFALGEAIGGSILLLAAQDDFVQNVRRLQFKGLILAIIVGAASFRGLDVRQPDVALAETHNGAGAPDADTGGARTGAGDLAHQGNPRTRQRRSISRSGRSGRSRISFPRRSSAG